MTMFNQLTRFLFQFACPPEANGTAAFPERLISDACAAEDMHCYGFKSGQRISRPGMITHCALLPARPHDIQSMDILPEEFEGAAPADKGFINERRQSLRRGRI
ncbi:hypothetical protein VU07_02260 [Desulfobulbus sp. F4]|nr:hypothetical protein [Desulfobulbus sp. F4]